MRFTLRRVWPFRALAWHRNRENHLRRALAETVAASAVERDALTAHRDVLQRRLDEWVLRGESQVAIEKVRRESREGSLVKMLNYCAAEQFELVGRARAHIKRAEAG